MTTQNEKYRLTEKRDAELTQTAFNWPEQFRKVITVPPLSGGIGCIIDPRLKPYLGCIPEVVEKIQAGDPEPLTRVEVIPARWIKDDEYASVHIRWRSNSGSFMREYYTTTVTRVEHCLVEEPVVAPAVPKTMWQKVLERIGAAFAIGIGIFNVLLSSAFASFFVAFGIGVSLYIAIGIIEFITGITWMDAWIARGNLYRFSYIFAFALMILEDLGAPHVPRFKRNFYRLLTSIK